LLCRIWAAPSMESAQITVALGHWIVNLRNKVVEVYSDPAGGEYGTEHVAGSGETLQLPGGLQGAVPVDENVA
jgi:hypothetical protein